ncbi:MAG: ABC transporter ATP-binding protein [Microbacterium ginsengisoli]|jgi:iron complex transport system ATP-binding protein|uniref:ABC transporter ATP-binding protein n=1 Tax=Microbacterium TaxID=33882 RepID=UPI0006F6EEB6|nr:MULTISPECIES: ABC transporter ATP-binding protein [unclassified Microbacterium]MBN9197520.1 ABC transporter ATP-binding protein [Microbacterium ginsengisoli]KQR93186.1 ABC transporter ATP-binding protein [Microbacterium sp. Leaf351]KQS05415.1 ABC transporter ATP-binding protein [Microbacterium sp. Leaf347]ODU77347.1 MAG: ABC transporter ATP-binding protein [Microbacterium sp. SCN 71-21]OJU77416.1 MAG: ABC transporter ATP-binding protein [Microbacterium sp. 71-23]
MPQVLEFADVVVRRNAKDIVEHLTWSVAGDERWVVLGPNGAGKTTVLQLAAALLYPTSGTVSILGERLGRTDVFDLRPRIGFASTALSRRIPSEESVLDVVLTAAYSVLGRWREQYEAIDERRALRVLAEWKLDHLADRSFGTLSDGEQKRVQIARAVMTDPELLMLDEPTASLDLGSREELVSLLGGYAQAPSTPAMIMVTHHVEEIPIGFTHVLLMREAQAVAAGPLADTLTAANLSATFGVDVELDEHEGRFAARAVRSR